MNQSYHEFINRKKHLIGDFGFDPTWIPDSLFDFQKHIVNKAIRKGRMGLFVDTGLGKTRMQLTIAQNVVLRSNRPVLILTPLAVAFQFIKEAHEIGIDDIEHSKDGKHTKKIVLCNYERLHYLDSKDFEAVILDESSILKNFNGKIKAQITSFVKNIKYRFLATATPAPNDYIELGTSSEALGFTPYMDMLQRFFSNKEANFKPQDIGTKWYLKPHAKTDFFAWVNQWSVTVRMPSDIGFEDDRYVLPNLTENNHYVKNNSNWIIDGQVMLFNGIAKRMSEVREEQKGTIKERCEKAYDLAKDKTSVYWCHFNDEGNLLEELDSDAVQIKGGDSIDKKEDILISFSKGNIKRLITKPKITSFGLNWQHCNHSVYFPTWSYEQYYQAVRRFWRFGQSKEVVIDRVLSDGQKRVLDTLEFKTKRALEFQNEIKTNISGYKDLAKKEFSQDVNIPSWIG